MASLIRGNVVTGHIERKRIVLRPRVESVNDYRLDCGRKSGMGDEHNPQGA